MPSRCSYPIAIIETRKITPQVRGQIGPFVGQSEMVRPFRSSPHRRFALRLVLVSHSIVANSSGSLIHTCISPPEVAERQQPAQDLVKSRNTTDGRRSHPPDELRLFLWLLCVRCFKSRAIKQVSSTAVPMGTTAVPMGRPPRTPQHTRRSRHQHIKAPRPRAWRMPATAPHEASPEALPGPKISAPGGAWPWHCPQLPRPQLQLSRIRQLAHACVLMSVDCGLATHVKSAPMR